MRLFNGFADFAGDAQGFSEREAACAHAFEERLAGQELHDEKKREPSDSPISKLLQMNG
jgi:hypothetical protein